jgi:hypothetical protein
MRRSLKHRARRGTEGSNLVPSSGEALANLTSCARSPRSRLAHANRGNPARSSLRPAGFEELATSRARSLQELAKRDGISRRYIRRLISLAFLSPQLVEAILQGRQPVELTTTRLTEFDLPLDWTEQHKLLAS